LPTIVVGGVIAGTIWTVACAKGPEAGGSGSSPAPPKASDAADAVPGNRATAAPAGGRAEGGSSLASAHAAVDVCGLLPAAEVTELTGLAVERLEKKPNGCLWFANAEARRQQGVDTVRSTFSKLNKQEPKSAAEGARSMESMLKGLTGAAAPDQPLLDVSVQWDKADEAEATLKGTVGAIGGGLPGGRFEPIEGLGDRAFKLPMASIFYIRKGAALVSFGMSAGTHEQAIAVAKRIVSRIQ
jgi:hypothetical protein